MAINSILARDDIPSRIQALHDTAQSAMADALQDVVDGRWVNNELLFALAFYLLLIDTHNG
jgi:hypothetical protein